MKSQTTLFVGGMAPESNFFRQDGKSEKSLPTRALLSVRVTEHLRQL